jgi:hypothetical protein
MAAIPIFKNRKDNNKVSHREQQYPVTVMCRVVGVVRSGLSVA